MLSVPDRVDRTGDLAWGLDKYMGYKFNLRFPGFQSAVGHPHRVVELLTEYTGLKLRKDI